MNVEMLLNVAYDGMRVKKKNEKKGKSHQNMTIGNSIAVYFYGTVQTVTKILYKNIIIS